MNIDIQTADYISELLSKRQDCKTAASIVKREATTERLRQEQEIPNIDQVLICCVISFAIIGSLWVWLA